MNRNKKNDPKKSFNYQTSLPYKTVKWENSKK